MRTLLQAVQLSRDAVVANGCSLHSWRTWCMFGSHVCPRTSTVSVSRRTSHSAVLPSYSSLAITAKSMHGSKKKARCVALRCLHMQSYSMRLRQNAPNCPPLHCSPRKGSLLQAACAAPGLAGPRSPPAAIGHAS